MPTVSNAAPTLLTGATGFVGSAVARALSRRGHRIRALVRKTSDRRNLDGLALEQVEGDLGDARSLGDAVRGCRYLFHVAADYRLWVPDPQRMLAINVAGTRALLEAARTAGVERVVYTSSVAALGLTPDGTAADETTHVVPEHIIGIYKRSKYLAEREVLAFAQAGRLDVVVVNPSTPVGPGDIKPTPTGRMIVDAALGRIPAFVDTGLNIVHVDDVAEGHLQALARGRCGERYILGGENLALRDLLGMIATLVGRRPPRLRLPIAPLVPIAAVAEAVARLTGRAPPLTRDELAMAKKKMFFSSKKAQSQLGYAPRPARVAVADAVAWLEATGRIPPGRASR